LGDLEPVSRKNGKRIPCRLVSEKTKGKKKTHKEGGGIPHQTAIALELSRPGSRTAFRQNAYRRRQKKPKKKKTSRKKAKVPEGPTRRGVSQPLGIDENKGSGLGEKGSPKKTKGG